MSRIVWLVCVIVVCASLALAGEIEFTFTNAYDGSAQPAAGYVPDSLNAKKRYPLLVVAHPSGNTRTFARALGYYREAERRGWLVVAPEFHGHNTADGNAPYAALETQHDVIDAIAYMTAHYPVDPTRIYLVGRSMGGMLAQVMAAKYPDLFAAVVAGQGISDLEALVKLRGDTYIARECGPYGPDTAFAYRRRSAIHYAPNFQYVPLILWHGTNDQRVPVAQTEALHAAIARWHRFQPPVHWLLNAPHNPMNYPPAWECEQVQYYQNVCDAPMDEPCRYYPALTLVTDEAQRIFWLRITPRRGDDFARVSADIAQGTVSVKATNTAVLAVDLARVPRGSEPTRYAVTTDGPLTFRVQRGAQVLLSIEVKRKAAGAIPPPPAPAGEATRQTP